MKLSIVVPAYNEEANIAEVIGQIEQAVSFPHELIVVNDHSTDNTAKLVTELSGRFPSIMLVDNNLEPGFANALRTGFAKATSSIVVPVMGDLCDDLSTLGKMLEKIDQGYDVVCGCRYVTGGARTGGSKLKGFLSSFAGKSIHWILGIPTCDIPNAFKMYRKTVIERIDIKSKGFEISMELPLKAYFLGFKITEVPTVWKERVKGKSSFKVFKLLPSYIKLYIWAVLKKMKG